MGLIGGGSDSTAAATEVGWRVVKVLPSSSFCVETMGADSFVCRFGLRAEYERIIIERGIKFDKRCNENMVYLLSRGQQTHLHFILAQNFADT